MNPTARRFYLQPVPLEEARQRLNAALAAIGKSAPLRHTTLPLAQALHRVTAQPVYASLNVPHYHAAAMDGFAVRAEETHTATETAPLTLPPERYQAVNTGEPLPEAYNAVIMIEQVQESADGLQITAPVAPWQHVRMMGEDMVESELLLPAQHRLRPVDLGALAASGQASVTVYVPPRVVIIPTGSELVAVGQRPRKGQFIEYNSLVIQAQLATVGAEVSILPLQPDETASLSSALDQALAQQPDLILILSGSSAGSRDYTANLIETRGQLLVHGVAVRPGHPVIMGLVAQTPIIGVPGYPVSAALTTELFIEPLIAGWYGQPSALSQRPRLTAQLTRKIVSPAGDADFVRVNVAKIGERWLASPLSRSAGVITALMRADGLLPIPRFTEGYDSGQTVEVLLYRSSAELANSLLMLGSHDPLLDLLAQHVAASPGGQRLSSVNVGSLGGLLALKRGDAHLAGAHLLDSATGTYNVAHLQTYLPTLPLQLVTFAHREQGLIVPKGNPLGLRSLDDLPRCRFVNRQKGAGTRLLLDYELQQRGLSPQAIRGYEREEYTHLAVAVAVQGGSADCGLGVRRAAAALGLDFVPVGWERYDLVIPTAHTAVCAALLTTLRSAAFRHALSQEVGYDVRETGTLQYEQ